MSAKLASRNKIYCMDYKKYLTGVKNKSIDLVVIDPPYNMSKDKWDTFKTETDFYYFLNRCVDDILPKLKSNGSFYIFNTSYHCAHILRFLVHRKMKFRNWIVWYKKDGVTSGKSKYTSESEALLYFTRDDDYTFNHNSIRQPYTSERSLGINKGKRKGIIKNGKRWAPNPKGKLCGDVWVFPRHRNFDIQGKQVRNIHPTQKPVEMIERIIKASSNKGDTILDCFVGSGTTAIACKKLGRNFYGCDSNKDYVKIAKARLNDVMRKKRIDDKQSTL